MCVLSTGKTDVTIGEPTAVCLVVNGLEWQTGVAGVYYSQVLILPDADEFSRFSVKGCEPEGGLCFGPGVRMISGRQLI